MHLIIVFSCAFICIRVRVSFVANVSPVYERGPFRLPYSHPRPSPQRTYFAADKSIYSYFICMNKFLQIYSDVQVVWKCFSKSSRFGLPTQLKFRNLITTLSVHGLLFCSLLFVHNYSICIEHLFVLASILFHLAFVLTCELLRECVFAWVCLGWGVCVSDDGKANKTFSNSLSFTVTAIHWRHQWFRIVGALLSVCEISMGYRVVHFVTFPSMGEC